MANDFFKPFISAEQRFQTIRRLESIGAPAESNKFEWPNQSDLRLVTLSNLIEARVQKIEYHVGGSIWSLRLTMSDGRQSPIFGTKNCLDQAVFFDEGKHIARIDVLESDDKKYVNAINFFEAATEAEEERG